MHLPVSIYTGAGHDDALFWHNAYQIVIGNILMMLTGCKLITPRFLVYNAGGGLK